MSFLGLLLELAGLIVTAHGLLMTWRANTQSSFLPHRLHRWHSWARTHIFRRSTVAPTATGGGPGRGNRAGKAVHYRSLPTAPDGETTEQRLERIEGRLEQLHKSTVSTIFHIADLERRRDKHTVDLRRRINATRREITSVAQAKAIEGLRIAVFGVLLLAVGAFLQAAAVALAWM